MNNTALVPYGIAEEQSDIRAHVSVQGRCVYVYPTKSGIEAMETNELPMRPAYTGNIKTAEGYLAKPSQIRQCRKVAIPDWVMDRACFSETDSTSEKGNKAVRVVQWLLKAGLFPLWSTPTFINDVDMQVDGMDIVVQMRARIQVKCDWRAGDGPGCTGNLYIQTRECNPFSRH
jgi:hypothetical protein